MAHESLPCLFWIGSSPTILEVLIMFACLAFKTFAALLMAHAIGFFSAANFIETERFVHEFHAFNLTIGEACILLTSADVVHVIFHRIFSSVDSMLGIWAGIKRCFAMDERTNGRTVSDCAHNAFIMNTGQSLTGWPNRHPRQGRKWLASAGLECREHHHRL